MNKDEPLQQQLAAWNVEVELPARFQADVWARIAAREKERRSWREWAADWFAAAFFQPRLAAAVAAVSLLVGAGSAYMRAQDFNAATGRMMEARYIASINPLAHAALE